MSRIQAADPAAQSHSAAAEEKIRLEGPETVSVQFHRRTEHPVGREPADPAGAVPLLRNRIAALDRKAVIVGCGPGNPPPVPTGKDVFIFRTVLHVQQGPVSRKVRQQILAVSHFKADRAFGMHTDRSIPPPGTINSTIRTPIITAAGCALATFWTENAIGHAGKFPTSGASRRSQIPGRYGQRKSLSPPGIGKHLTPAETRIHDTAPDTPGNPFGQQMTQNPVCRIRKGIRRSLQHPEPE